MYSTSTYAIRSAFAIAFSSCQPCVASSFGHVGTIIQTPNVFGYASSNSTFAYQTSERKSAELYSCPSIWYLGYIRHHDNPIAIQLNIQKLFLTFAFGLHAMLHHTPMLCASLFMNVMCIAMGLHVAFPFLLSKTTILQACAKYR